jgi:hypothetical protein
MKTYRWTVTILAVFVLAALLAGPGCTAEFPLTWKATQPQRQAADLAAKNTAALRPYTLPEGEPIRADAQAAAEVTREAVGLPATRPDPTPPATPTPTPEAVATAAANAATIRQAATDAARPPVTPLAAVAAGVEDAGKVTQTGFVLADQWLTIIGSIAAAWGAKKIKDKVVTWRADASAAGDLAAQLSAALAETVRSVEAAKATLTPEQVAAVQVALKAGQTADTRAIVDAVRAGGGADAAEAAAANVR